jgi:NADPH:quinone reductase-like Zn-dependent oxidoreductase
MRAIVLSGFGGLERLVIKELPDPEPKAGHVLIAVKAFGVNQAETHMLKVSGLRLLRSAESSAWVR